MDWLVIQSNNVQNAAHFGPIVNYDRAVDLRKGTPLAAAFPASAQIQMDSDFPDDIELVDSLRSNGALLIINERVSQLFEAEGINNLELLPIKVLNHKKKPVKERYFVVNILSVVDCIDMKESKYEINTINKKWLSSVAKLVLDHARLPKDVKLFRPTNLTTHMLIARSVAEKIKNEGLRGFLFTEVADLTYP